MLATRDVLDIAETPLQDPKRPRAGYDLSINIGKQQATSFAKESRLPYILLIIFSAGYLFDPSRACVYSDIPAVYVGV